MITVKERSIIQRLLLGMFAMKLPRLFGNRKGVSLKSVAALAWNTQTVSILTFYQLQFSYSYKIRIFESNNYGSQSSFTGKTVLLSFNS
ncbi:hypothetical protein SAMN05216302_101846 [Nitrosomonas aestuarii]|uniref:Uncharacterized protein n=1 Tax=Nitrosomonas aestuarii TaxID=52441 RepID=A0A1I4D2K4_9PROT|nr:hypothetical protein SAMN05216302_101846 [Nitrosomonas aestuarii]